ncbi:hypothetical protein AAWM_11158 [Aspergillus awamori]|uniref:Uncharacterized protein n=1 Tax=Aspergillus awamori TaxID=105351 RepID=A0A401L9P5_ASPAW|nr:hypothetical protein AAWM_11158 [Aspergillus awamori]
MISDLSVIAAIGISVLGSFTSVVIREKKHFWATTPGRTLFLNALCLYTFLHDVSTATVIRSSEERGLEDRDGTPSGYSPSLSRGRRSSTPLRHSPLQDYIRDTEWDLAGIDGGEQYLIVRYSIEWRVTLNNRVVAKDTEQDLGLDPNSYWSGIKQKAEDLLRRKIARNRRVRLDDTTVVVSVNDRSQRDLITRFEKTDVDWTAIQKQLTMWQNLFQQGKRLRLCISINYLDSDQPSNGADKRGQTSVTRRMLHARDAEIDAEQVSGQPSTWRDVYRVMPCPGSPCRLESQYCWQDPVGKKYYRLRTHHLRKLVRYVEQEGGVIEYHDDVPDNIHEQLSLFPININVLPTPPPRLMAISPPAAAEPPTLNSSPPSSSINVPGPLEVAVENYAAWQLSRVNTESFKDNIIKARDIALNNCLDLKQIYQDQDPGFFINQGVKLGAARRFVTEINVWVQEMQS